MTKPTNLIALIDNLARASLIHKTIKNFCFGSERVINEGHLPKNKIKELVSAARPEESSEQKNAELQEEFTKYINESQEVWQKITDVTNKELKIDHASYLKLFALNTSEEAFSGV